MSNTTHATLGAGWGKRFAATARRFAADRSGTTAIEYAVMTLIAVAVIALVTQIGGTVNSMYEKVVGIF